MNSKITVPCLKVGMTRMFNSSGKMVCGSILDVSKGTVVRMWRHTERCRAQLMLCDITSRPRVNKPQTSYFIRNNCRPGVYPKEVSAGGVPSAEHPAINFLSNLRIGMKINVRGISIGKGFSGVIRRHGFSSGPASHGTSKAHNQLGSTGMTQDPGRVFKGKKMPGRMGNRIVVVRNLEVLYVSKNKEFVLVSGAVPGCVGTCLFIWRAQCHLQPTQPHQPLPPS